MQEWSFKINYFDYNLNLKLHCKFQTEVFHPKFKYKQVRYDCSHTHKSIDKAKLENNWHGIHGAYSAESLSNTSCNITPSLWAEN